ncbi:hypothetical protein TUM4445_34730 [Shewanella sp. MBTL60-112-B2]|nr:hypothetical protein TUM4444_25760 [Shewanella sp. MBTL60-112-B1]GIU39131.1 hypothetical protein TUM4445_34730 [Shewanella sp. MBTL60-112-B2]
MRQLIFRAIVTYADMNMCTRSKKTVKRDVETLFLTFSSVNKMHFNHKKGATRAPLIGLANLFG